MTLSHTPGQVKKFGRTPWRFQTTFKTPLQQLDAFVFAILVDDGGFQHGSVTIDGIIFEPKNLNALLAMNNLPPDIARDSSIAVDGSIQLRELLKTALSDWIDFWFIPTPKPFVIYADHDEYTTFLANTKSNLNRASQSLLKNGFEQVQNYQRKF